MRLRRGVLLAVLALVWWLGSPDGADGARCKDEEQCRDCFDRGMVQAVDESDTADCDPDDLIGTRREQAMALNVRYGVCAADVPGRPGSCRLTIRELNDCRRIRNNGSGRSWTAFKRATRRQCGRRVLTAANRARRQCLRSRSCECAIPADVTTSTTSTTTTTTSTTSTTSSTTTTSTVSTTTTTAGTAAGASTSTTTTTTTSTTTSTASEGPVVPRPEGSGCQQRCIQAVIEDCRDDCFRTCKGDQEASPKCFRACRNAQCDTLRRLCVPGENTDFDARGSQGLDPDYFACCKSQDDCDFDDEDTLACVPTTTTSTTSTTPSTSTTSTIPGQTTTTLIGTTTTLLGTTTTTLLGF